MCTTAAIALPLYMQTYDRRLCINTGKVDLVTETDKACEQLIFEGLQQAFPSHSFIGEEGSAAQGFTSDLGEGPTWLVDPLDGRPPFYVKLSYSN